MSTADAPPPGPATLSDLAVSGGRLSTLLYHHCAIALLTSGYTPFKVAMPHPTPRSLVAAAVDDLNATPAGPLVKVVMRETWYTRLDRDGDRVLQSTQAAVDLIVQVELQLTHKQ